MNRRIAAFLLAFSLTLLVSAFSGCSHYSYGSSKPAALAKINSIHVDTFRNNTYYPRAEVFLTSAIVEELTSKGTYKSESSSAADCVLKGTIRSIYLDQVRAHPYNTYRSLQTAMKMEVVYEVMQGNKVLKTGSASVSSNYFNQDNQQSAKSDALSYAVREAAAKIVSELVY